MSVWDKATDGMDVHNWPHRFTKNGTVRQVGEDPATHDAAFAQPMICMDCNIEFVSGMQPRPADPCPARTMLKEKKRLMS